MRPIYKIVFLIIPACMLTACSSCNILSSRQSASCTALLVGGAVVTAPVLIPTAIIKNNVPDQSYQRNQIRFQKEIAEGKLSATFYCLANQCKHWQQAIDNVLATDKFPAIMRFYAHVGAIDQQYQKSPIERNLNQVRQHLHEAERLLELGISTKDIKKEWLMYRRNISEENSNFNRFLERLSVYRVVDDLQQRSSSNARKTLQNCAKLPLPKYHHTDFITYPSLKPSFCEEVYLAYHGASYKKGNNFFSFDQALPKDIKKRWNQQMQK